MPLHFFEKKKARSDTQASSVFFFFGVCFFAEQASSFSFVFVRRGRARVRKAL